MKYCKSVDERATRLELPTVKEDGTPPNIMFEKYQDLLKCPYVIYADCESIIKSIHTCAETEQKTVKNNIPVGRPFAYNIVRSDGKLINRRLYRGEDAMEQFFKYLEKALVDIRNDLKNIRDLNMTDEDEQRHSNAATCWICNAPFVSFKKGDEGGLWKVKDHDHITGKYRGAAHSKSNMMLCIKPEFQVIPVFFHNLKGYDAHLLMSVLGNTKLKKVEYINYKGEKKIKVDGRISCIAQNMEKLFQSRFLLGIHC